MNARTAPVLDLGGESVPVAIRRSARARAMSLKLDPRDGAILLVLPDGVSEARGLAFARSRSQWLAECRARLPPRIAFAPGAVLPLEGAPHRLVHDLSGRRGVWAAEGVIGVSGQTEFFARRLKDWLKRRAGAAIAPQAATFAEKIGRRAGRVAVKDTRSRWGSCSSRGDLAFSWRLILAPPEILTYVVAHEVAHLDQMNHSPAFWRLVGGLVPDVKSCTAWLKANGTLLHRYG